MNNNCPICNKAGLPDYTKRNVICPQCNSDLKPFLLLHTISKPKKSKLNSYIIASISLLSIVLLGLFLKSTTDTKELITRNLILNDSITKIQSINRVHKEQDEYVPIVDKQKTVIKYVVKKGDYPYKLARFFYNDGSKYKQIEADNNLVQPYILKVGQTLTIKISYE
jgi:hypothetical protein